MVMDGHDEHSKPGIGDLAKDKAKDKVGVLMGMAGGRYLLRPTSGGLEWEVEPENLDFPTSSDRLRAENGVRNRMTRLGL
ncbi:hypothetical protein ADL35_02545 [Streptomyces sp. NRRL WC-3753]|nr:hypothetical protein ADL35_02545 [Streptomyces sp. NRRL WC-3753]